jgi:hypothetical protein
MNKKVFFMSITVLLVGFSGCLGESESIEINEADSQLVSLEIINDCENTQINVQSTELSNGSILDTTLGINVSVYHAIYTPNVSELVFG